MNPCHIIILFFFTFCFLSCERDKLCECSVPEQDLDIYVQLGEYLYRDSALEGTVSLNQQSEKFHGLIQELTLKPNTVYIDRYYGEVHFQGVQEQETWYMEHDYLGFIYVADTDDLPHWDGEDKQFLLNCQSKLSNHLYLRSVTVQN